MYSCIKRFSAFSFMLSKTLNIKTKSKLWRIDCVKLNLQCALHTGENPVIETIHKQDDGKFLTVSWNDGKISRYPYIFLRSNCKCPQCYDQVTQQKCFFIAKNSLAEIDAEVFELSDNDKAIDCTWKCGHSSRYSFEWLYNMRMPEKKQVQNELVKEELILWNREILQGKVPCYKYRDVMNDDHTLFDFLYTFYRHGIILIENAPKREGVLSEIASRVGYNSTTHYGSVFDVKDKNLPSNLAYTNQELPLHMDLPQINSPPNIQLLHCVIQNLPGTGGFSLFLDGFYVSKIIYNQYPDAFEVLKRFYVPYVDVGSDVFGNFRVGCSRNTISLNRHGRISSFHFNEQIESDYKGDCTPDELLAYYDALQVLTSQLNDPKNIIDFHLKEGRVVMFHNQRLLHGRSEIVNPPGQASGRWLQGTYLDWDAVFSKLRVLKQKLRLHTPYLPDNSDDFF